MNARMRAHKYYKRSFFLRKRSVFFVSTKMHSIFTYKLAKIFQKKTQVHEKDAQEKMLISVEEKIITKYNTHDYYSERKKKEK